MRCKQNPKKEIRFEPPVRESSTNQSQDLNLCIGWFGAWDLSPSFLRQPAGPVTCCSNTCLASLWSRAVRGHDIQWPLETVEKTPESLATFTEIHSVFRSSGVTALKDVASDDRKNPTLTKMMLPSWILDSAFWILCDFSGFSFRGSSWMTATWRKPQTVSDDSDDNDGLAWITSERPRWSRFLRQNWGQGPLEGQRVYECLWIYVVFICDSCLYVHAGILNNIYIYRDRYTAYSTV